MIRSLPLAEWPQADRAAWLRAMVAGQRLRRGGLASHLAPVTRTDLERHYGSLRWLGLSEQHFRLAKWSVCRG